ncbi:MAG: beta-lactamase family protein [Treponema sp.]|nr:beta-lactamase family protein [Treponema sp.]
MLYTQGKVDCKPKDIGYNEKRLDVLNNHFQCLIDDGEIQCATYCISRKGKIFAHGGIGKKSFRKESNEAVQPDSIRWIASVTKVFAAVALMKLVEDGVTRLDVPVGEILPQFDTPPYNGITIFQLLTHTSGLHADGGCFDNKYQTNYWDMIDNAYKLHKKEDGEFDWLTAALGTIGNGLRVKPDTEWAYCSFGFIVIGAIIEKLTGMSSHKYIEDNICKPLGLKDTLFDCTPEMVERIVVSDDNDEKYISDIKNGTYQPHWIGEILKIPSTGGGLNGTSFDLNRFGNMMLYKGTFDGVRILGRKAAEKMTTFAIHNMPNYCWGANDKDRGFGVGFDMRNGPAFTFSPGTFNHEGAGACSLYVDPQEELVAAWIVPFAKEGWWSKALFNVINIIWSGLL